MAKSHYISPSHDKTYGEFVKNIREDIGRKVKVHGLGDSTSCPNCLKSSADGTSAGIYHPDSPYPAGVPGPTSFTRGRCPVCKGSGQYVRNIVKEILCHIRWKDAGSGANMKSGSAGFQEGEEVRLQSDVKYFHDFRNSIKVEVDDMPFEVTRQNRRGLKTLVQTIVFLKRSDFNMPGNAQRTNFGGPV